MYTILSLFDEFIDDLLLMFDIPEHEHGTQVFLIADMALCLNVFDHLVALIATKVLEARRLAFGKNANGFFKNIGKVLLLFGGIIEKGLDGM